MELPTVPNCKNSKKTCTQRKSLYDRREMVVGNEITDALNSVGYDKRTVLSVKSLWDNLLKTAKKEVCATKKIPTGGGPALILLGMSKKILAIYGENSPIFLGLEGLETNDIEVVSDIEISAMPVVFDATNSATPNTVTTDEKSDNENNLGQIKHSSNHEKSSSETKKKRTPGLHLSTVDCQLFKKKYYYG
nr:uncharacterized protein LOC124806953 [Hydra vulgaris]